MPDGLLGLLILTATIAVGTWPIGHRTPAADKESKVRPTQTKALGQCGS